MGLGDRIPLLISAPPPMGPGPEGLWSTKSDPRYPDPSIELEITGSLTVQYMILKTAVQ